MKTILIVEDDEKLRKELEIFLNKNGYNAVGLDNFEDTVNAILKEKSDLVLLDINLPIIDGEFVCKELRKKSDVPIIMVTSKDNELDELISMNYGADDYVTKPYNIQIGIFFCMPLLLACIHSIFGIQFGLKIFSTMTSFKNLTIPIIITAIFIVLIYGGYFLATYFGSKRIIRDN